MTERKPISVAIVDNSIQPEIYAPVGHWSRYLGVPWRAFTARNGEFPVPGEFSHLILTGSEASILERDPWVETEAGLVRSAAASGTPVLGSCWGHQLIAYALAGPGCVGRCPSPEIGWIAVRVDRESDLLGAAGTVHHVFSVHFDEVRDGLDRRLPDPGFSGREPAGLGDPEPSRDRRPRRAANSPRLRVPGLSRPGSLPGGLETGSARYGTHRPGRPGLPGRLTGQGETLDYA
jgi:GMP synthase-like glutamine amidotransferase